MTGPAPEPGTIPVGPMLSMFNPIHVGSDEFGLPFYIWATPGILEAMKPGRMQGHGGTAEIPG
jgi:hypothetical protein